MCDDVDDDLPRDTDIIVSSIDDRDSRLRSPSDAHGGAGAAPGPGQARARRGVMSLIQYIVYD